MRPVYLYSLEFCEVEPSFQQDLELLGPQTFTVPRSQSCLKLVSKFRGCSELSGAHRSKLRSIWRPGRL